MDRLIICFVADSAASPHVHAISKKRRQAEALCGLSPTAAGWNWTVRQLSCLKCLSHMPPEGPGRRPKK